MLFLIAGFSLIKELQFSNRGWYYTGMGKDHKQFKLDFKKIIDLVLFEVFVLIFLYNALMSVLAEFFPVYRITKPILIAILFLYLFLWLYNTQERNKLVVILKHGLIILSIFFIVVIPTVLFIILRLNSAPEKFVHDGLIYSEYATKFFMQGKNPYVESYANSPLKDFPFYQDIRPDFNCYMYLPATFLFPLTIQIWLEPILGWFDQRIVYILSFIFIVGSIFYLIKDNDKRSIALSVIGLNPFFAIFLIQGRNDVLVLFWIIISIICLSKNHFSLSACLLAIGCATKPFAWCLVPFFFLNIWRNKPWRENKYNFYKSALVFLVIFGIFVLPWIIDDSMAFFDDVIGFQSGLVSEGWVISGFGFSSILVKIGVLSSIFDDFPFASLQITLGLLICPILLYKQLKSNSIRQMVINYFVLLGIVFFFARAFHDNYFGYLMIVFTLGILLDNADTPIQLPDKGVE